MSKTKEMKILIWIFFLLLSTLSCFCQKKVGFEVTGLPNHNDRYVGIRGDVAPLSWEKTIFLNKDGEIYSTEIEFASDTEKVEYKFVLDNGQKVQWEKIQNRNEILMPKDTVYHSIWNQEKFIDPNILPKLSVKQLMEDYEVIRNAVVKIHPGLFRYNDSLSIEKNLKILKKSFQKSLSYEDTFLALSKFIATIQCDHTSVSSYNQEALINSLIHRQKDKLPFTFKWVENRMIVTHSAAEADEIRKGTEVLSINEVSVGEILSTLLPFISADGATKQNKVRKAEINGYSFRYSAFDVLYPLLYPVENSQVLLSIQNQNDTEVSHLIVETLTREERNLRLITKNISFPKSPEDLWEFKILEDNVGYLKIGSFATNDFQSDWKLMLKNIFKELEEKEVSNLILDIRANQGGMDEAPYELEKYIYKNEVVTDGLLMQSRFLTFPEDIKSNVDTWDNWFYNLTEDVHYKNDIYYVFPDLLTQRVIRPTQSTYKGQIYMLIGANNVSGAFYLARLFKKSKSGKLIGQETSGNQRGINGGTILFLKPPNSRINVNLPIMGTFSTETMPNRGVEPDILIDCNFNDVVNGIDSTLKETLEIIKSKK